MHVADDDGHVHFSRLAFVRPLDAQPTSKGRETHFDDGVRISHRAVHYQSYDAEFLCGEGKQITPRAGFHEALGIHDEHIPWFSLGQSEVNREVVVRAAVNRQGRAA
ncbi:hypothetical protein D3C75_920270 [compost metagenome]